MKLSVSFSVAIAIILSSSGVVSFAPVSRRAVVKVETKTLSPVRRLPSDSKVYSSDSIQNLWQLHGHDESIDEDITAGHCSHRLGANRLRGVASKLKQKSKPVAFALATAASFASCLPGQSLFRPQAAHANAPIVLREKLAKNDPPMVQAMTKAKELKKKLSIEEFDRFMQKCNDIEDSEGKAARAQYEAQYKIDQEAKAAQKIVDIENLKRDLLDEGRDPNTDIDAENEVWILEHGIDLTKVPGTPHNEQMVKNFQSRGKNVPTYASQRYIVKCQVADLTARGIDPLEHFSQPEIIEKTRAIYKMDNKVAAKVAKQYEMLMEQNGGRITPAKEGETPFVRPSHDHKSNEASSASANDERAQEKAAAKAKRAAEREAAKQEKEAQRKAKAEAKAQAKADLALAKEKQLAEKKLSKEEAVTASAAAAAAAASATLAAKESAAVAAATSSAHKAADSEIAATAQMDFAATAGQEAVARSALEDDKPVTKKESGNSLIENIKSKATVKNVATVVIGGGAAAYGFNYYMENNSGAQSEREKQLKLILGGDLDNDEDDEDDDDMVIDDDDDDFSIEKSPPKPSQTKAKSDETKASKPTPPSPEELPSNTRVKKRKLGIFSKKKANARETDLNALLSSGAKAPEFASLLAKILTFGAPGRFPAISNKGDMPFDEFKLEKAKSMLEEARAELDLSEEEMAEMFASVVNCMIIDIIDLASSTLNLKDKDEKVTSDAINVVMDFMDHAASLFDSVAKVSLFMFF